MICEICKLEFTSSNLLSKHLSKIHNIDKQQYYDKFLKKEHEGLCLSCGKPTRFKNISSGYFVHCSAKCSRNDPMVIEKTENTTLSRFGVKNVRNSEYYKIKSDNTKLEKYGDKNYNNREKAKKTSIEKYGVESPIQYKEIEQKRDRTNMYLFGTDNYTQNLINKYGDSNYRNKEKAKQTCLEKYGVNNPFAADIVKTKIKDTLINRYNVDNIMKSDETIQKVKQTNLVRYGFEWSQQSDEIRKKQQYRYNFDGQSFDSSWEIAYYIWLKDNNINFIYQPNIRFEYFYNNIKHYYCPDFLINNQLYEIKGLQFFENDKMINPYDRSMDDLYEAKHQCMIKNNVTIITDCSEYINYVSKKYTKDFIPLFKNNLEFPYINTDLHDTSDLGIIQHFHKSIYEASRKNKPSPILAWQDKELIRRCALNRLKYVGSCKPSDILQGFNVTKIAAKISVFKPNLAKTLITKYLNDYTEIFDPFSGFSGRMIASESCNKKYIGQDIHEGHIKESNEIIKYKNYTNSIVSVQDILTDTPKTYECLFTCPPYGGKEHWNKDNDEIEKSCDEWIDICLEKYNCKSYLFVVDKTEKYKDNIVETLENKSHLGKNNEYVIVIKNTN